MKKTDLIHKVKQLEGLSQDERAYLIDLINTKKKYGLVWEDKPEDVEEQLRDNLPVLREIVEKRIVATPAILDQHKIQSTSKDLFSATEPLAIPTVGGTLSEAEVPNHILIEGDNLHALTALTFTHEGKIDVIYIDPPYNTGNKDFKYNDSFVDREDSFRHSKWISFMNKRLQMAKRLLCDKGVIFISIDDNEQAQLKMLCDEIFGEKNEIGNLIWKARQIVDSRNESNLSIDHEYILVYRKAVGKLIGRKSSIDKYSNPDNDPRGPWMSNSILGLADIIGRPNLHYDLIDPKTKKIYPCPADTGWRYSPETMAKKIIEGRIIFPKKKDGRPREKKFISENKSEYTGFGSILNEEVGYTLNGTRLLREVLPDISTIAFPKPVELIRNILTQSDSKSTIVDFFAGSGTTLHATMQLNAEDGGNRQCILVTNNENNICEEVTYERNKRVIQGYTNAKGVAVLGLQNNNLRYYKSEFVSREPSIKNKQDLTRLATELLCIKEDIYLEEKQIGEYILNSVFVRVFHQNGLYLLIIYDEDVIEQMVEVIQSAIEQAGGQTPHFKVYVFSNGQYPFTEEFEDVLQHVTLCALPDAIYKAYQNVLPKRQRKAVPVLEEPTAEEVESSLLADNQLDLFNQ
jgi:adenine-specific DNA-methyltransferase